MNGGRRGARWLAAIEIGWWWGAAVGIWLLTLSSVTWPDLTAAVVCGLPCGLAARAGRHAVRAVWRPSPGWARWLLPLPAAILTDTARVLGLAARSLTGAPQPGEMKEIQLPAGEPDEVASARRAVAALAFSTTPGTFVVDNDPEEDRLVIHSLTTGWPHLDQVVSR